MTCPHQSRKGNHGAFTCALGWYGGRPYLGNCLDCMKNNRNTPESKAAADARAERTHPSTRPRISGCCDRADQS